MFFYVEPLEDRPPATRVLDLGAKRPLYADQGVAHPWLIDPDARTLEAFALEAGCWLPPHTLSGEGAVALPPFDAIALDLAALWA